MFDVEELKQGIVDTAKAALAVASAKTNISGIMADIMHSCKDFKVKEVRATLDGMVADVYEPLSDMHYELNITTRRGK